ncbi:hypothetical protein D1007_25853 [Hordeum vulgare]|nr:hypothetical protein D1007_25853 [Hordeum vulgare]
MAGRDGGNHFNRGDGAAEGRFGRGGGRSGRGGARERGGGGEGRNLVWMRDNDEGGSSNVDPRHGSSDKARWDADAMEQGGERGSEKWGNSNNIVIAGAAGGKQPQAQDRRHPTPGKRNAAPLVGGAEVCVTCKDPGHLPAFCPRAVCGRCGNHGHLASVCNTVLPWECVAPMCGFQARGKGFFYIHDHSTPNQNTDRNRFIVISVVEGQASGRQLEEFFNAYINTNWRCSARSIGPKTFVMRFPSPRDVDKACFAESMNVKSCGAVINLRKWSESMGAKGILNIAWVNVSNTPLDKRHEKNIAYVGSLVGVTLEIDKATINRPESVRIKLDCRDAENIPTSAEGVLGDHFYDFFFSVDKILVKNPQYFFIYYGEVFGSLWHVWRKNMMSVRLDTIQEKVDIVENQEKIEETQSDEESEDVDNVLLIDSMAAEAEKSHMKEIEKQSTVEPTVTEMKNDDKNYQKEDQAYFVQSPGGSCEDVDVVPTPPVLEEVQARFSKRTVGINMEHVCARAEKMTKKRNLQGNEPISENSFDVLSNMEIVNMASHMGVNIPDDDFTIIDVIRELEKSRANIAKKINIDNKQREEVLLITNAAGESSHLNTTRGG